MTANGSESSFKQALDKLKREKRKEREEINVCLSSDKCMKPGSVRRKEGNL